MEVNSLFTNGKVDEAITRIIALHEKEPFEFQFSKARDSLVNELRNQAEKHFAIQAFDMSLPLLLCLKKYEYPPRIETLNKISICQYNTGKYDDALQTFNQLYSVQPWNLELVYQIGIIHMNHLGNEKDALDYFRTGKKIFRENLTEIYGEAFTIVMNPADLPDIYAHIFLASAEMNFEFKNYREALKDLNWVVFLRPHWPDPYKLRALVKLKTREFGTICSDLATAKRKGGQGITELQNKYCR